MSSDIAASGTGTVATLTCARLCGARQGIPYAKQWTYSVGDRSCRAIRLRSIGHLTASASRYTRVRSSESLDGTAQEKAPY